jgi:hypothetical protein
MAVDWQQLGVNVVSSASVAVLTAALTAKWAVRRFQSERWWERKAGAYSDIARSLFLMKRYCDEYIDSKESGSTRTDEYEQELTKDWQQGNRAIAEATALGTFLVSPDAAAVLEELRRENGRAAAEDDFYERASVESAALQRAIAALTSAARRDLRIHDRSIWTRIWTHAVQRWSALRRHQARSATPEGTPAPDR